MARKILLADDSVTAQNMGRKILTDAGYDVITVNNGSAALKRVAEHKPDLIVLDVYMPGYSGLEVCARLKDAPETSRIPILLTVGKLEPFKPEEAQRVRADAFIVKPFEASELLSALTRLEDRMVPQAEGARFSTSVSGIERFSGDPAVKKDDDGEGESGWKSRLRFPSKKKKEESEPEPEADADFVTTPYRQFKRGGKAPASAPFPVNSAPAGPQEPGLVPDIPRDITPEELDALSELVAKLDGPIPAAENITALGEQIGPAEPAAAPAETAKEKEAEVAPAPVEAVVETKPEAEPAAVAEAKNEPEASATVTMAGDAASHLSTDKADAPAPAVAEAVPAEAVTLAVVPVEATVVAAEPAPSEPTPADTSNEPAFATAATVEPTVAAEEQPATAVEIGSTASPASEAAVVEAAPAVEEVRSAEEPKAEEVAKVEEIPQATPAASTPKAAEAEAPAPSPEELAEALRLLTPHTGAGSALAEAGAALAEELARGTNGGSRWVAEAVALSPEEASMSLEAEMFRTFASAPASTATSAGDGNGTKAPVGHEEEEAAEAAVEAAEAVAESRAEAASAAEESPAMVASGAAPSGIETEASQEKTAEAEEETAPTTFADAVRQEEAPVSAEAVSAATGAAGQEEASSSEDAAEEAMGKDGKKGGKSNWHQIRTGAPAAAAVDAVEAAKQTEEAPKAMAAAAAEGSSEASAIASIVDSVLADLRPKIVEEIAKKLAKK